MSTATQLFYAACDPAHREFFSALLYDWQEIGQPVAAGDDEAQNSMQLQLRSVGRSPGAGGALPCLFVLHAGSVTDKPRISLDREQWRHWFGAEARDAFIASMCAIPGLIYRQQAGEFAILEPANLSGPTQQQLRHAMLDFARRSREEMGL